MCEPHPVCQLAFSKLSQKLRLQQMYVNDLRSFFSFNLSFTLKICFEREMERVKLMTALPSLIFSV